MGTCTELTQSRNLGGAKTYPGLLFVGQSAGRPKRLAAFERAVNARNAELLDQRSAQPPPPCPCMGPRNLDGGAANAVCHAQTGEQVHRRVADGSAAHPCPHQLRRRPAEQRLVPGLQSDLGAGIARDRQPHWAAGSQSELSAIPLPCCCASTVATGSRLAGAGTLTDGRAAAGLLCFCSAGTPPADAKAGSCGPTCAGTGQLASWLTWAELSDDGGADSKPAIANHVT